MKPPVILAVTVAAVAGAGWGWGRSRTPPPVQWQGYAEADFVKVGPTQQGLLTTLAVRRGSKVTSGAALFDQDDTADQAAKEQAARQLRQAEEQLANLQAGGKPTEIRQAEANLATEAARDKLLSDLNATKPWCAFAVSVQHVDELRADLRSAVAKVQGLEAAFAQMRAPLGRDRRLRRTCGGRGGARRGGMRNGGSTSATSPRQWLASSRCPCPSRRDHPRGRAGVSLPPSENIFVRFFGGVAPCRFGPVHRQQSGAWDHVLDVRRTDAGDPDGAVHPAAVVLLSGFMFPFQGMPVWAQWLGEVLPITHALRIMRGMLLKGNGLPRSCRTLADRCLRW